MRSSFHKNDTTILRLLIALIGLFGIVSTAAAAPDRYALIIANANYPGGARLANPVRDGKRLAEVLRQKLGFRVIERYDVDLPGMRAAMRDFRSTLTTGSIAFVYYSGHGVELDGTNYLLPIGYDITTSEDIPDQAYQAKRLIDQLAGSGTSVNVLILDACRDNPLPRGTKGVGKGLAEFATGTPATLIHYATAAGRTANDDSTYINALINELSHPGRSILETFNAVGYDVSTATSGKQSPWMYVNNIPMIQLIAGSASFSTPPPVPAPVPVRVTPPPPEPRPEPRLDGSWSGNYGYRDGRSPVSFKANLIITGNDVSGSMEERNTFGSGARTLYADIRGQIDGSTIRFTKTYDGAGGYDHSVEYTGSIDRNTGMITGVWELQGMRGSFSMQRH